MYDIASMLSCDRTKIPTANMLLHFTAQARLTSTGSVITFARAPRSFLRPFEFIPLRALKCFLRLFSRSFDSAGFFELLHTLVVCTPCLQASGVFFLRHFPFRLMPMLSITAFRSALALPD